MGSTFIALPLTSGEAFLLRTTDDAGREWTILVDGGKKYSENSRELAKVLAEVSPRIERIDIVVCTHSDSDHSQGLWYLAEDWYGMGRSIGEFWLPGRWANAMPDILTDPSRFAARLVEGAYEASKRVSYADRKDGDEKASRASFVSRELRYRNLAGELDLADDHITSAVVAIDGEAHAPEDGRSAAAFGLTSAELHLLRADTQESDDSVDPLTAALQHADSRSKFAEIAFFDERSMWLERSSPVMLEAHMVLQEVAETAQAIRRIALAALERKIGVRWFDFGEYAKTDRPSGGEPGLFEPLCSVEVIPDQAKLTRLSAFMLVTNLRLTRQNVESLVFYRPETRDAPGVLFLGDSRLAHGIERPEKDFPVRYPQPGRKLLVTAPHHGSDHNDNAFSVLDDWLGPNGAVFVRNGGQSNQKLADFLGRTERRCAQCVQCHGKEWNQWVAVTSSGNSWNWPPSANVCGTPKT